MSPFDLDQFIDDCREALGAGEPRMAIKEVLARAVATPSELEHALPATRAELVPLYSSDDLTVVKAVWSPGMVLPPHNHRMWAAIGVYGGSEDNAFYRREGTGIVGAGGKVLATGDVTLLGREVIHGVTNPRSHRFTSAIHVYGGDFMHRARSVWEGDPPTECPATGETMQGYFERANAVEDP